MLIHRYIYIYIYIQCPNPSWLVVYGYVRGEEIYKMVPIDIVKLIFLYFPKQCKIYGVGSNLFGEFAINECKKVHKFRELQQYSNICDDANDFYYGSYRFLVKNIKNEIYSAGWNLDGALGIDSNQRKILNLKQIKNDNNNYIVSVSNGLLSMHSFIIDKSNKIYGIGNNKFGQCGVSPSNSSFSKPFELINVNKYFIKNNIKINKIHCGAWHTLFLSKCGRVFSCGRNRFGQCGVKKYEKFIIIPTKIPFLYNIKDIKCGELYSICLDKNGDVYVFGYNQHGQLGINNDDNNNNNNNIIDYAKVNPFFKYKNIVSISCGNSHSLCIDDDGLLWLFGRNQFGQIGNGYVSEWDDGIFKPHLFQSLNDKFKNISIASASCGLNHTIILTKSTNKIYAFGENYYNQCSTKLNDHLINYPELLTREEIGVDQNCFIKRVIAGYAATIIIIEY